jgi:hypothetical protein
MEVEKAITPPAKRGFFFPCHLISARVGLLRRVVFPVPVEGSGSCEG